MLRSWRVNALKRATCISTIFGKEYYEQIIVCQCPKAGDMHFYGKSMEWRHPALVMCQCPEAGDMHFYFALQTCIGRR